MAIKSAGILFYRIKNKNIEVLLAHPGGPFFAKKEEGVWSIPKGEFDDHEESLSAAIRETKEETGIDASGDFFKLTPVKIKSGKIIQAWALEFDIEGGKVVSNHFTMEWPPKSGRYQEFPEIDRIEWFPLPLARQKINPGQLPLLAELEGVIKKKGD